LITGRFLPATGCVAQVADPGEDLTAADAGGGKPLGCCSANVGTTRPAAGGSLQMPGLASVGADRFASRPVPAPAPKQPTKKK
jgi:hypothetical protein